MTQRIIWPILFGVLGVAVLMSLGIWQMQRLAWKTTILAEIEAQIATPPGPLPPRVDPATDTYRRVTLDGRFGTPYVRVLVSHRSFGPSYRIISPFQTNDQIILIDRGIIPATDDFLPTPQGAITITGNLHWPDETDAFTPDNDVETNIWFARDVAQLAAYLGTEPILVIAGSVSPPDSRITPLPVTTAGIPNNHLGYAIQWFGLAVVWLGMTGFFVWRITRQTV